MTGSVAARRSAIYPTVAMREIPNRAGSRGPNRSPYGRYLNPQFDGCPRPSHRGALNATTSRGPCRSRSVSWGTAPGSRRSPRSRRPRRSGARRSSPSNVAKMASVAEPSSRAKEGDTDDREQAAQGGRTLGRRLRERPPRRSGGDGTLRDRGAVLGVPATVGPATPVPNLLCRATQPQTGPARARGCRPR